MRRRRMLSLIMTAALLFAAVPAFAEEDDPSPPPFDEPSPVPSPFPSPVPSPFTPPSPPPSPLPSPPVFPDWFYELDDIPAWIFMADSFPPWFSELPGEPVWFRTIDRFPDWFFTITEIPDWFYQEEPEVCEECLEEPCVCGEIELCEDCGEEYCVCEEEPELCEDCLEEPCACEETPTPCFVCWEYPCVCGDLPPEWNGYTGHEIPELPFAAPTTAGELRSSVPNGMISGGEVRLNLPAGLFVTRNEFEVFWTDGEPFRENGRYEIFTADRPDRPVFTFTVAIGPVNFLDTYTAPSGFFIAEARHDGEALEVSGGTSLPLEEDGAYFIVLQPEGIPEDGEIQENLFVSLEIDRTPPELFFEGVDEDGLAYGEVRFIVNKEAHVRILRNSRPYADNLFLLTEPGHYIIAATDRAGNESVYHLRIGYRMNASGYWVIVLFAVLLAVLVYYLIRNRRRMRVR